MSALRVVIVEDDALLRTSLVAALPLQGIDVVGSADGAAGALELIRRVQPDAALLDLDLGVGPNGIDIAQVTHVLGTEAEKWTLAASFPE